MLPRLHIVTSDAILAAPDFVERAAALVGQFRDRIAIQLRSRAIGGRRLHEIGSQLKQQPNAFVVVNDRVDVARVINADAVQLRANGLSVQIARAQLGETPIGRSVHSAEDGTQAAADGADYLLAGSIYETASHPAALPQGPVLIRALRSCQLPVLAIGGVDDTNVGECMSAGAYGAAVIRAVWQAADPVAAVKTLLQRIEESVVSV
jgi:thiamine-phosphate diphosphorylase